MVASVTATVLELDDELLAVSVADVDAMLFDVAGVVVENVAILVVDAVDDAVEMNELVAVGDTIFEVVEAAVVETVDAVGDMNELVVDGGSVVETPVVVVVVVDDVVMIELVVTGGDVVTAIVVSAGDVDGVVVVAVLAVVDVVGSKSVVVNIGNVGLVSELISGGTIDVMTETMLVIVVVAAASDGDGAVVTDVNVESSDDGVDRSSDCATVTAMVPMYCYNIIITSQEIPVSHLDEQAM